MRFAIQFPWLRIPWRKDRPVREKEQDVFHSHTRWWDEGSEPELLDKPAFAMSQVGSVVAIGVVFENLGCLASIEPPVLEGGYEQSLDLRQGEGGSFF